MSMEYRIGHCVNCGEQTWVLDKFGRPVNKLPGIQQAWLCLMDKGELKTKIGILSFCSKCDVSKVSCEELKEALIKSPISGVSDKEPEWRFADMKLEKVEEVTRDIYSN